MRRHTAKRWEMEEAAKEFDINTRTLSKRLKVKSIAAGKDGKFATLDICKAAYGDIDGERLRLTRAQADEKELSNSKERKELVRFDEFMAIAHRGLSAMTSAVMGMIHLNIEDRETIIKQLRSAGEMLERGNDGGGATTSVHG